VATQAESALADLRDIEANLSEDPLITAIDAELPVLAREIQARLNESAKVQTNSPSLETLRTVRIGWQHLRETLSDWQRALSQRAARLSETRERLTQLATLWEQTQAQTTADETPIEVRQRIDTTLTRLRQAQEQAETRRTHVLTLQGRVLEQDARVAEALATIRRAQDAAVDQLFVRGSAPLWIALSVTDSGQTLVQDGEESFTTQATALGAYALRKNGTLFVHLCLTAVLVVLLYRIRRGMRALTGDEPSLKHAARVFETPIATGLLLTLFLSGWMYPQAPRLWWAIIGATALVPTAIVLRRQMEPPLVPVLYALVGFYFVDQLRAVTATLPLVARLLFLAEMLGGICLLLWLLQSNWREATAQQPENQAKKHRLWTAIRLGIRAAIAVFAVAFLANILGFVSLAIFLGDGILGSAYFAMILYALFRIVDGLIVSGLRVPLLSRFGFVQRHHAAVRRSLHRALQGIGILLWTLYTLELFALRAPLMERLRAVLAASLTIGSFTITLGNVLGFAFTVWAAFFVSRVVRFLLEEDVYPRFHLARGLPYAISTMLHYLILLLGFFLAMAAMGVDMTKFTILAGAFGVGLGFGMQNIVNNFVSGLILLFERPIKIGDVIETADASGVVERIGIRASVVRTASGSEVIVPNGKFISDRVTNWTFTNNRRVIKIPVSVSTDADPERVIRLLTEVAEAHPHVEDQPPPQALLASFAAKALNFELNASTDRVEDWEQVRSEIALAVREALAREEIAIA
jgi:small-conductance mechanosensitive channel